jgi:hypothetical protein
MATEGDRQPTSAVLIIQRTEVRDNLRLLRRPTRSLFLTGLSLLMVVALLGGWANLWHGRRIQQTASPDLDQIENVQSKGWKLVGGQQSVQGQEQFVLVEEASESNPKLYDEVIRRLCRKDEWCGLQFWSDSSLIPDHLPMSDLQAASEVANYTQNPDTGFVQFVWNCRVHNDPLNCFSYE